jgi:hypothetical protein
LRGHGLIYPTTILLIIQVGISIFLTGDPFHLVDYDHNNYKGFIEQPSLI